VGRRVRRPETEDKVEAEGVQESWHLFGVKSARRQPEQLADGDAHGRRDARDHNFAAVHLAHDLVGDGGWGLVGHSFL